MSEKKINDGPAFPVTPTDRSGQIGPTEYGITIRDYFAAKAMAAMITTAAAPCMGGLHGFEVHVAEGAYQIADAMMEARDK